MAEQTNVKTTLAADLNPGNGALPPAFEEIDPDVLLARLRASDPDEFRTARTLLNLIERGAAAMNAIDRLHLARLVTASGHAIELSTRKERGA